MTEKIVSVSFPEASVVEDTVAEAAVIPPVKSVRTRKTDYAKATLFVRNVPFDCQNGEFEAFFSEFGPLKGCFVVKDPENEGRNRGIGFVHFAMPEDAERTMNALKDGSSKFRGRALQADWAQQKNLEASKGIKPPAALVAKPPAYKNVLVEAEKMQECVKIVLRFEQNMIEDSKLLKALVQRLRRFSPIKEVTCPYLDDNTRVLLEYSTPKSNYMVYRKLFAKLNTCLLSSVVNTNEVTGTGNETADLSSAATDVKSKQQQKLFTNRSCILKEIEPLLPEPIKAFRLIIRNLPFNITRATQLSDYLNPYGEVLEVNIPTVRNENQRHGDNDALRGRGFAFVQFSKRTEAEKAIEGLNGSIVKTRAIAVDWALAKKTYDELEAKTEAEATKEENNFQENVVMESEDSEIEENSEADLENDEENENENENDEEFELINDREEGSDAEESENEDVSASSTIFIRNLSFDTDEDSLEEFFLSKIPKSRIEYCKIVRNPDTGASRGTAFIKFVSSKSAAVAVEIAASSNDANSVAVDAQLADLAEKRTKKGFHSIVNDPDALMASQAASGFLLDGRILSVTLAVDRKEAADLGRRRALDKISSILNEEGRDRLLDQLFLVPIGKKNSGENPTIPRLKRNLALINESLPTIEDDSTVSPSELKARESVIQSRAKSSQNNPNLIVSTTRLAVHHLPSRVTEAQLKEAVYAGVKEARAAAQSPGNPLKLSKKMLQLLLQFDSISKVHSGIHQLKIILHKSKNPSANDTGAKSRGYGFVEWRHPLMALLCVRWFRRQGAWSNTQISQLIASRARAIARDFPNDPESQISTPVVEFATEKLNVLSKRNPASSKKGKGSDFSFSKKGNDKESSSSSKRSFDKSSSSYKKDKSSSFKKSKK